MLGIAFPATVYVGRPRISLESLFVYQLTLSSGAFAGLVVGYHEAGMVSEARETVRVEAERQRLEYLNHLLRHDISNNLQVIAATLDFVVEGPDSDDVSTRLETARLQMPEALERESPRGAQPKARLMLASRPDSFLPGTGAGGAESARPPGMVGRERRRGLVSGANETPVSCAHRKAAAASGAGRYGHTCSAGYVAR